MDSEIWYSSKLAKSLSGECEVVTPVGRIDVLTDTEVIEVKYAYGWKSAIGQVMAYGYFFPDRQKRIHLIGEPLAGAIALLLTTTAYPLTFRMSMCEVHDNTFELHDTTYRLSTVTQKEGGAIVRLCVREMVQTKQNNLVETAGSK